MLVEDAPKNSLLHGCVCAQKSLSKAKAPWKLSTIESSHIHTRLCSTLHLCRHTQNPCLSPSISLVAPSLSQFINFTMKLLMEISVLGNTCGGAIVTWDRVVKKCMTGIGWKIGFSRTNWTRHTTFTLHPYTEHPSRQVAPQYSHDEGSFTPSQSYGVK